MIISEKQIMQLMQIANESVHLALKSGDNWHEYASVVSKLIDTINSQQSSELKVIEELCPTKL